MRIAIFDNEGVLVRSDWDSVSNTISKCLGVPYESGNDLKRRFKLWKDGPDNPLDIYGRGPEHMTSDTFWDIVLREAYQAQSTPERINMLSSVMRTLTSIVNEESIGLVKELKNAGHKVFMLSNAIPEITQGNQRHGYYALFDKCYISWRIGHKKPTREAYETLLSSEGLDAVDCFLVDDTPKNVEAARSLGMGGMVYTLGDDFAALRNTLRDYGFLVR